MLDPGDLSRGSVYRSLLPNLHSQQTQTRSQNYQLPGQCQMIMYLEFANGSFPPPPLSYKNVSLTLEVFNSKEGVTMEIVLGAVYHGVRWVEGCRGVLPCPTHQQGRRALSRFLYRRLQIVSGTKFTAIYTLVV